MPGAICYADGASAAVADQELIATEQQTSRVANFRAGGGSAVATVALNTVPRKGVDDARGVYDPYAVIEAVSNIKIAE